MFNSTELLQGLSSGIIVGLVFAVLGVGFNLLWGVTRVINMAHVGFALIGSYIAITLLGFAGIDPLLSILFIVPVLFCLGLGMHYFLIKPTAKRAFDITTASLVLTFGVYLVIINLLVLIFKADSRELFSRYSGTSYAIGPVTITLTGLISLAIAVVTLIVVNLFLNGTYTGKAVRAVWQNMEGAMLSGINVDRVTAITYGVSFATAGISGLCLALIYSISPFVGLSWIIFVFLVSILGGLGSVIGTAVGGLIIGIISSTGSAFIPFKYINLVLFLLLLLILLVRPSGLFRR